MHSHTNWHYAGCCLFVQECLWYVHNLDTLCQCCTEEQMLNVILSLSLWLSPPLLIIHYYFNSLFSFIMQLQVYT